MNGWRSTVAGQPVKLVCSCVRNPGPLLDGDVWLAPTDPAPRDGDLVVVRCLDSTGAYDHVEDQAGAPVKLYRGDVFLAVLGTRRSGTNLIGEIPPDSLQAGSRLDLVAQGGLVARCMAVPAYYGSHALPVECVAFPAAPSGLVRNIADAPLVPVRHTRPPSTTRPLVFVCGSSAEVGKTTVVCGLNIAAKTRDPTVRTAAVKVCGTGRARDVLHYRAANYDVVTDFVDAGLPSTYRVPQRWFQSMVHTLVEYSADRADLVVVEIGGDLLEARAPEALEVMAELGGTCVLMVNDAMGALEGLRRLAALGLDPLLIGTLRQNPIALADRLGKPPDQITEPGDARALGRFVDQVLSATRIDAVGTPAPSLR
jgi:hypothetical protein